MSNTVPLAASSPMPAPRDNRKKWIAAIIVAFILGFLLGWFLHKCPQKSPNDGNSGAASTAGGGGGGGGGSPQKVNQGGGDGGGGGGGGAAGSSAGGGGGGGNGGGDADEASRPSPDGKPDSAHHTPAEGAANQQDAETPITRLAGGKAGTGTQPRDTIPAPPHTSVLAAKDFSYDSTGLPRYASDVQGVASGVVADTLRQKKMSQAVIFTNDPFDSVVTWYKSRVPAGWHAQSMGDLGAVAKAMSPQSIMGMLSGASNGKPVDTAAISAAMNGSGDRSVAIFNPPDRSDTRSIMIAKVKGKPTEVIASKQLTF